MDIHLLVYDLSRGMARTMSQSLLGFQLDAIYHTSIELAGREHVYDGGIVSIIPGSSHLGRPMQRLYLGKTELPMDVIEEYLDSVRPIFTVEAYDLFKHNCNNFTDSFSKFLLGKGIPDHIINMPDAVLQSPMGRMLMPQLMQSVNANRGGGSILGIQDSSRLGASGPSAAASAAAQHHTNGHGSVQNVSTLSELDRALDAAKTSCAVVFFTSRTCGPCRMLYPVYDELSAEIGTKASLIKVDVSMAPEIGSKYSVRATPTFMTFLKGEQENRWTGSDPTQLRGNINLLVQMAWPAHPHQSLKLPSFAGGPQKPVLYQKVPPIPKLLAKMGNTAHDKPVGDLKRFIEVREKQGPAQANLPDPVEISKFIQKCTSSLSPEVLFAIVDLFRCAMVDPRLSGAFAEETGHKAIISILQCVNESTECPYALRLVTLQLGCNLFSSPIYAEEIIANEDLRRAVIQLISTSFLDDSHDNTRVAAASLMFNAVTASRKARESGPGLTLPDDDEVELAASVLEAISQEEKSPNALRGMLVALGHMFYKAPLDGDLADLLRTMDAEGTISAKRKAFPEEKLIAEVGTELLGKGLRRP